MVRSPTILTMNYTNFVQLSKVCPNLVETNNCTDLNRVLEYYRYKIGSTLDAAKATGILRNSITWYVSRLEKKGLLQVVCIKRDKTTGYMAKHYCADTRQWKCQVSQQLSLFEDEKF